MLPGITPALFRQAVAVAPAVGNDSYTKILLHFEGSDGAGVVVDYALGKTVAHTWYPVTYAVAAAAAQKKFGNTSLWCQLTTSRIALNNNVDLTLGSNDFTIDCWFYPTASGVRRFIWGQSDSGSGATTISTFCEVTAGNVLSAGVYQGGTGVGLTGATTVTANVWHHAALVRSGSNLRLYLDGVQQFSAAISGAVTESSYQFTVGALGEYSGGLQFQGYIDEFRYSVGIARWTSNFAPPSAAYGPDPVSVAVSYLLLAGGGGGGGSGGGTTGGGGGAGGMLADTINLPIGSYPISVGAGGYGGGTGQASGGYGGYTQAIGLGYAYGGGGGGLGAIASYSGLNGGCGGGGGGFSTPGAVGGNGTQGQGWGGGTPVAGGVGGGGGGRTSAGGSGGAPGSGQASSITGSSVTYATGGDAYGGAGSGVIPPTKPDTSGEGGNGSWNGVNGGFGGTGVAIFSYTGAQQAVGGQVTSSGGKTIHRFVNYTASDTFVLKSTPVTAATETKLLLHCDGANASTVFVDSSVLARGNATVFGNAQVSTAQSKFGGGSLLLDGAGDYLEYPTNADWEFGAGNFTIDWWEYRTANAENSAAIIRNNMNTVPAFLLGYSSGGNLQVYMSSDSTNWNVASAQPMGTLQVNSWHHFAVVRNGNTFYTFKDGVQTATWVSGAVLVATGWPLSIGRWHTSNFYYQGHLEEIRVVKGIAVWTSNFTPPTSAYT